jgi:hypothetical protein
MKFSCREKDFFLLNGHLGGSLAMEEEQADSGHREAEKSRPTEDQEREEQIDKELVERIGGLY